MTHHIVLPWPDRRLHPNGIRRSAGGHLLAAEDSGLPDAEEVRRLFSYNQTTGEFVRIITIGMRAKAGTIPGSFNRGYRRIPFRGRAVEAHRLAWLYVHGCWPAGVIDHINGDASDNRIENLRDVDRSTNTENQRRARSDNQLGVLGVRRSKSGRFEARIWVKGKPITIGTFSTAERAHQAYLEKKRELHAGCSI